MSKRSFDQNVNELARTFTPLMHIFHHVAGQVSKVGEFSLAQYRVLMLIYHDGPISINDLKERLNIAQSSASEMVDRLVHQDFLRKEKSENDRRITLLHMTAKTERLLKERMKSMQTVYRKILEPLTQAEQKELVEASRLILQHLKKSSDLNTERIGRA